MEIATCILIGLAILVICQASLIGISDWRRARHAVRRHGSARSALLGMRRNNGHRPAR